MDISSNKDEEENSMHNTVVLFSSSDKFTLHQVAILIHILLFSNVIGYFPISKPQMKSVGNI